MNQMRCPKDVSLLDVPDQVFPVAWSSRLVNENGWHTVSFLLGRARNQDGRTALSSHFSVPPQEIEDRIVSLKKAYPDISTLIDNSPTSLDEFKKVDANEQGEALPPIPTD